MSQAHGSADIIDRVVSAFEISLAEAGNERTGFAVHTTDEGRSARRRGE